ncbi:MAG: DUF4150 domain-containing protein [Polyangiaceae bacterium]
MNQSLSVTSTTSNHVAVQKAPDVCFTPDKKAVIPHSNTVNTSLATEHTTPKTQIAEGPVVRQADAIGPTSTSGDGGACGKGVGSGTCMQEARTVTASPNVTAEGKPVARNTDPTTQNHGNTSGGLTNSNPAVNEADLAAEKLKACSLDVSNAKCKHGRENGADRLLEVATPCSVTLEAKRKNAKVANAPPECASGGIHTQWECIKKEKGGKITKKQTFSGEDKIVLDNTWFEPAASASDFVPKEGKIEGRKDESGRLTDKGRAEQNALRDQQLATLPKGTANRAATARDNASNTAQGAENISKGLQGAQAIYQTVVDFKKVLEVINWDKEPLEVSVEGKACSGACKYTLRGYPGEKVTVKVDDELINKVRAVLRVIEAIVKGGKTLASYAGGSVDAELHILRGCEIEFAVNWKELTEDNAEIKKYKHMCDLEWAVSFKKKIAEKQTAAAGKALSGSVGMDKVAVGAANLAAFALGFGMEIVTFINVFLPSVGTIAAKVLNWLGAHATAGIDFKFEAGIEVALTHSAGETGVNIAGGISTLVDIYINIKLTWGSSLEVSGGCFVKVSPSFGVEMPLKKRGIFDMTLKVERGVISFGFRGVFKVDTWWYKTNQSVEYVPPWAKVDYGPYELKPLASLA